MLPFKNMIVPPAANNMFKYRKGARRLSDWITAGSSDGQAIGLPQGVINMQLPALVAPPPGQAAREARAGEAWARAKTAQRNRSRLRSVVGDSEDAQDTRRVVDAVMGASGAYSTDSDDEMAGQLEKELQGEGGDGSGPSRGGGMPLEDIRRSLMADSDEAEADGDADHSA